MSVWTALLLALTVTQSDAESPQAPSTPLTGQAGETRYEVYAIPHVAPASISLGDLPEEAEEYGLPGKPAAAAITDIPASAVRIRALTQNCWMVPFQGKVIKRRAGIIGCGLRRYDLALLQEAFLEKPKQLIFKSAGSGFTAHYAPRKGTPLDSGQITMSRCRVTRSCFKPYSTCRGAQCLSGRGILYVQIQLPNGVKLDTFNVHLQAMEEDHEYRKVQMCDLMSLVRGKNDGTNPVLIAGDFNVIARNREYCVMRRLMGGYRDVWAEANPGRGGYTWDPRINTWGDEDHHESRLMQRLDYIFIRDGRCAKWSVECASLAFNGTYASESLGLKIPGRIFASDHFGVAANLMLQPQAD